MKQLLTIFSVTLLVFAMGLQPATADWDYGYHTDYEYIESLGRFGYQTDLGWYLDDDSWLNDDQVASWNDDFAYDYDDKQEYRWELDYDFWDGYEWELEEKNSWF